MFTDNIINILLIEDEEYDVQRVKNTLQLFEQNIRIKAVVSSGIKAINLLEANAEDYDVVIMDYQISGGLMGEKLIRKIKTIDPLLQVIVITKMTININDLNFANELIQAGAFWFCTKYPGDVDYIYQPTDFSLSIFNAKRKRELEFAQRSSDMKLSRNIREILSSKKIIGSSQPVQQLHNRIDKCAATTASVMITGPSGSGKELVAANIHYRSERKYENFVAVNCGSIPTELIESELFGYTKGAFTGADKNKEGLFEYANKGTLFLDEVAELPHNVQVKLLRVLQEGELEKIGSTERKKVDVRIISATNKDLKQEVVERRFREDLFYRLNVIPIRVPSLAERADDITLLFRHFLGEFSQQLNIPFPEIRDDALEILRNYEYPGNIRELKNITQRILFDSEGIITPNIVRNSVEGAPIMFESSSGEFNQILETEEILPFSDAKKILHKKYLTYVRENSNSDAHAAEQLGMAPSNFHRICKEHGLK
ncbi:MAG: acetoacetate metabolism regulatory protein AtoC [Melioribacteraceae bacterium]|nr:MAG: acetoacetate metabolism regulatory protein AtoC [Melioribacteraceae bacterium]